MLMQLVVTFQHLFPHLQVSERIQTMGDEAMSPILPQGSKKDIKNGAKLVKEKCLYLIYLDLVMYFLDFSGLKIGLWLLNLVETWISLDSDHNILVLRHRMRK
jgi:hypothetical protein